MTASLIGCRTNVELLSGSFSGWRGIGILVRLGLVCLLRLLLAVNGVVDDLGVFSDFPGFCDLVGEGGLVIYGEMMLPLAGSKRARASPIKDFVGDTFVGLMNDASAVVVFNFAISAFTLLFGLAQHLFGLHLIGLLLGDVFGEGGQAMLVPVDGTSESTDLCFAAAGTDVSF